MTKKEYADILLPNVTKTKEEYEKIYKRRNINENSIVTRFAPSPTGFVHIGHLFTSFVANRFAKQTNGICLLRIEDTDTKRTVENGINQIIKDVNDYGITFNEGAKSETEETGEYGPYIQSKRKDIYQSFAKYLIENDLAYPCFMTEEDLENIRKNQENKKERIGIYGKYAKYRGITPEEAIEKINNNEPYIIRFKSSGKFENRVEVKDAVRGVLSFPENDIDIVIIKNDGLPTYHFAHLVDDYLMGVTHVIRTDEWLSSLPIHVQLFDTFNYKRPVYAHLSPLTKKEGNTVRKLSKRLDPELAVSYYHKEGIPTEAVKIYILTIINSNFEEWYENNLDKDFLEFELSFEKVSTSGSLFDLEKLTNISKNYISKLTAKELYERTTTYSQEFDKEFYELLTQYKDYSINVLNIERETERPRKDIESYGAVKREISYMYDELFKKDETTYEQKDFYDKELLTYYIENVYDENDDKQTWFNKIKELCPKFGFASETKEYKKNPEKYKGSVAQVCEIIRVAVTHRIMTSDLYEILKLLGKERIKERFNNF